MSTATSGESVLSGVQPVRGCSRGFWGVGGLAAAVCLPGRTGSDTQCPSPMDMGVLCSIPFSTCSWLPWGSHQLRSQGELRGTGCSQPDLSPGEGMEPEAGRCWAGSRVVLGWDGRAWGHQGHTAPHPWAASTLDGPREQRCEWGQRGHPCPSRMGPSPARACFMPGYCSWCCGHSHCSDPSWCGAVSCPPLCQPGQVPKPLEGIVGSIW